MLKLCYIDVLRCVRSYVPHARIQATKPYRILRRAASYSTCRAIGCQIECHERADGVVKHTPSSPWFARGSTLKLWLSAPECYHRWWRRNWDRQSDIRRRESDATAVVYSIGRVSNMRCENHVRSRPTRWRYTYTRTALYLISTVEIPPPHTPTLKSTCDIVPLYPGCLLSRAQPEIRTGSTFRHRWRREGSRAGHGAR